jgi:hypothetical protein
MFYIFGALDPCGVKVCVVVGVILYIVVSADLDVGI